MCTLIDETLLLPIAAITALIQRTKYYSLLRLKPTPSEPTSTVLLSDQGVHSQLDRNCKHTCEMMDCDAIGSRMDEFGSPQQVTGQINSALKECCFGLKWVSSTSNCLMVTMDPME